MSRRHDADGLFQTRGNLLFASLIRSVQRGEIVIAGSSASNTATITAVNMNNSLLRFLGCTPGGAELPDASFARLAFTNATTITATRDDVGGGDNLTVAYEVVEYVPGVIKSIQRGTITAVAGSATASITAVNTAKSHVDSLGYETNNGGTDNTWLPRLDLQDSTTVRVRATAVDALIGYQVVEWF